MHLLVKDHKVIKEGQLPPTRPVVAANTGLNVPLSEILCHILEPIVRNAKQSAEVVSSEQLLNLVDQLNAEWNTTDWTGKQPPVLLAAEQ